MLVAAIQMTAGSSVDAALARADALIAEAASEGARLVALPEYFAWTGPEDKWPAMAVNGPRITGAIQKSAVRHSVFVVAGTALMPSGSKEKALNVATLFSPDGARIAEYGKMKLFDATTDKGIYRESSVLEPGASQMTASIDEWTLGIAVCFELRFPSLFLSLRAMGANMIAVPSAFTRETGKDHWHTLIKCRAMDSQCYIIAPALCGEQSSNRRYFGHSAIIDPWGEILAMREDGEGIVVADISMERVEDVRGKMPLL